MKCKSCQNNNDGFCEPLQIDIGKYDCRGTLYKARERPIKINWRIPITIIVILMAIFIVSIFATVGVKAISQNYKENKIHRQEKLALQLQELQQKFDLSDTDMQILSDRKTTKIKVYKNIEDIYYVSGIDWFHYSGHRIKIKNDSTSYFLCEIDSFIVKGTENYIVYADKAKDYVIFHGDNNFINKVLTPRYMNNCNVDKSYMK